MEDHARRPGDAAAARAGWLARVLAAAAVVALLLVVSRSLGPGADGSGDEPDAPALHRWDLVGCWDLRVAPWTVAWRDAAGGGTSSVRGGSAEGERRGRPAPRAGDRDGDLPGSFAPPARLMLLPDSVDRWGRVLPSRRAVPLAGPDRPGRSLRWAVNADTLWLLWVDGDVRAGAALRPSGDSLSGRVRTIRGRDSLDATAAASARKINCSTGDPEPSDRRRELERR